MRTIFKYPLRGGHFVDVPWLRSLLDCQLQGEEIVTWFEVNMTEPKLSMQMIVLGTGHVIPKDFRYLKTIQQPPFVWHVYYKE